MGVMTKKEGWLLVDHSASPGLPEAVARAAGYDPKLCREGKKFEAATLTCSHCRCTVVKNPNRVRAREVCYKCGCHYICDFCYADMQQPGYSHTPYEKLIDTVLAGKTVQPNYGIHQMGMPLAPADPAPPPPPKLILPPDFKRETV